MALYRKHQNRRKMGRFPLAYMGSTDTTSSAQSFWANRAPTTRDYDGFFIGCIWIDQSTAAVGPPVTDPEVWMLVLKDDQIATWIRFYGGGGSGFETLTGDTGTNPVFPDGADNIDLHGTAPLVTRGDAATNSVYIESDGTIATSFVTNNGTAIPAGGILNVSGDVAGSILETTGAGNTINTEFIDGTADGQILISQNGGKPGWNNLASGDATVVITNGPNTIDLSVPGGGIVGPGENINIGAAVTINLNRVIRWPDTNAAGTEGVIYQAATCTGPGPGGSCTGGIQFLHSYGKNSVFLGHGAGNFTLTGEANIGIGGGETGTNSSLMSLTSGKENTAVGTYSGYSLTTGELNAIFGAQVMPFATTADYNSAIGTNSLRNILTGSRNTVLGYGEGSLIGSAISYTGAESDNLIITNTGVLGENNTMRIGTHGAGNGQQDRCFIAGIRGITTAVVDAIPVLIDSSHQLGTVSSSIRYKENVQDLADESSEIYKLRPVTFNYKQDASKSKQYGLIAEEVEKVLRRLVVFDPESGECDTVKYHELPVLLLNEIIKLNKRIEALEKKC